MNKIWKAKIDGRKLSYTQIVDSILDSRDIRNLDRFLQPIEEDFIDYKHLKNIESAGSIVVQGIKNNKTFYIYDDLDCDGATSSAILYRYLSKFIDSKLINYRRGCGKSHGLDVNDECFKIKYDIIIIPDSIESTIDNYQSLLDMGSQIVVLDHHEIPNDILSIQKYINLVSSMNEYPNPYLSGAGVAFKFCKYLDTLLHTNYADEYWDLAACGICADMMDVSAESMENRYICQNGFKNIRNPGIKAILGKYPMNSTAISFSIAPLINAGIRMKENLAALNLFMSDDPAIIEESIKILNDCKVKQNELVDKAYQQVEAQYKAQEDHKALFFILDDSDGISGLIANKALNDFQRPIIVVREAERSGEKVYNGSIRGIGVDNFADIVNDTRYAKALGHSNAAGFTMYAKDKDKFIRRLEEILAPVEFEQTVCVDIKLFARQITSEFISWTKKLNEISGQGFPPITILIDDVTDYEVGNMSKGKHTKISVDNMIFIKWNSNDWETLPTDKSLSFIGTLDQGFFGKQNYLQLIINDYKIENKIEL